MEQFLASLLKNGEPILTPRDQKVEVWVPNQLLSHSTQVVEMLRKLHDEQSLNFPGEPLLFHEQASLCGLKTLFILTSATAFREIEISQTKNWLKETATPIQSPEEHFAADLCLRHLANLRKTIAEIADGDPLLQVIQRIGSKIPLSSVGIPLETQPDLTILKTHPQLAQLHAERVIERADFPRAAEPDVAQLITKMVGSHHQIFIPNFPTQSS